MARARAVPHRPGEEPEARPAPPPRRRRRATTAGRRGAIRPAARSRRPSPRRPRRRPRRPAPRSRRARAPSRSGATGARARARAASGGGPPARPPSSAHDGGGIDRAIQAVTLARPGRGGRVVECTGLENRRRGNSSAGSNPAPSAPTAGAWLWSGRAVASTTTTHPAQADIPRHRPRCVGRGIDSRS